MLILTRRNGESIIIGDEIEVSVLSTQGQQVRIGIHAPKDIPIQKYMTPANIAKHHDYHDVEK